MRLSIVISDIRLTASVQNPVFAGGRQILFCSKLLELGNFLIWESLADFLPHGKLLFEGRLQLLYA